MDKNKESIKSPILQRIKRIIDENEKSIRAFSLRIDSNPMTINSLFARESNPSYSTINAIACAYPKISMEWLILGIGEMYLDKAREGNENFDKLCDPEETYGDIGSVTEIEYLRSENARLSNMVGRLEGKVELLQEQLGYPKKAETFKGKSA